MGVSIEAKKFLPNLPRSDRVLFGNGEAFAKLRGQLNEHYPVV